MNRRGRFHGRGGMIADGLFCQQCEERRVACFMKTLIWLLVAMPTLVMAATPEVRVVRCPDGGVQPQGVVDSLGKVHLIYLKGEDGRSDVFYVWSGDGGQNWSKALRVNSQAGAAIATGTVRGAHLAIG